MTKFHITVHGDDRAAMADIVRVHGVRVYGQTLMESGAGSVSYTHLTLPTILRV